MITLKIERADHSDLSECTAVSNDVMEDARLSWKARGLLRYMLSMPDDWDFSFADLLTQSREDGAFSLRSGLDELKKFGYLEVVRERSPDGKFGKADWIVREEGTDDSQENSTQE